MSTDVSTTAALGGVSGLIDGTPVIDLRRLGSSRAGPIGPAPKSRTRTSFLAGVIRTARPKQWSKNVLVLAAPASAGVLTSQNSLARALVAFGTFCLVASGTYFLNDALDTESDRSHPTKRYRPVAAGVISVPAAMAIGISLMGAALAGGGLLSWKLGLVLAIYVGVQFAYSYYLKHQPVYDLASVASGFVLRAIAGAVAVRVPISEWFLIVATFGSLLMVTGKRLGEYRELGEERGSHRSSLEAYSPSFLRCVLAVAAAGAIIGYCIWALSLSHPGTRHYSTFWCQISIAPIFVALLKYAYLVERGEGAKPEDLVMGNRSLQVLGVVWLATFSAGIYAG